MSLPNPRAKMVVTVMVWVAAINQRVHLIRQNTKQETVTNQNMVVYRFQAYPQSGLTNTKINIKTKTKTKKVTKVFQFPDYQRCELMVAMIMMAVPLAIIKAR